MNEKMKKILQFSQETARFDQRTVHNKKMYKNRTQHKQQNHPTNLHYNHHQNIQKSRKPTSPSQNFVPSPHRHTINIERMQNPQPHNLMTQPKRSTHRPDGYQNYSYNNVPNSYQHHCLQCFQNGSEQNLGYYQGQVYPVRNDGQVMRNRSSVGPVGMGRQFLTMAPTPRITVGDSQQHKFVIQNKQKKKQARQSRKRKQKQVVQNQFSEQQDQSLQGNRIQNISILSKKDNTLSSSKHIPSKQRLPKVNPEYIGENQQTKNIYYHFHHQPVQSASKYNHNGEVGVNYAIQNQRHSHSHSHSHSHKRSEYGPMPVGTGLGHRRLATTIQQYEDEYSKTQTQQQVEQHKNYPYKQQQIGQKQIEQNPEYRLKQRQYNNYDQYEYYPQQFEGQQVYYDQHYPDVCNSNNPFLKKKRILQSMEQKYKNIQQTMQLQNQNLKQHNQYLLAVIKKMQIKDRKNKETINMQNKQILKITEERNAYMERCLYLEQNIAKNQEGLVRWCSVLNLDAAHSRGPSDVSSEQAKVASINQQLDRNSKIDELKQHLQSTLSSDKTSPIKSNPNLSKPPHQYNPAVEPQQNQQSRLQIFESKHESRSNQPSPLPSPMPSFPGSYIPQQSSHCPTPQFSISQQDSPARRPRFTAKISNSSNGSDISSTVLNDNSGILNFSNSFGGNWVNNSGYSLINGLRTQLADKRCQTIQNMSDIQQKEQVDRQQKTQQQQQIQIEMDEINRDEQPTAKNSNNHSKHMKSISKTDEQSVQELNIKFEELMRLYRVNHDISIRKQCVQIAKKIKQLKNQIQNRRLGTSGDGNEGEDEGDEQQMGN